MGTKNSGLEKAYITLLRYGDIFLGISGLNFTVLSPFIGTKNGQRTRQDRFGPLGGSIENNFNHPRKVVEKVIVFFLAEVETCLLSKRV